MFVECDVESAGAVDDFPFAVVDGSGADEFGGFVAMHGAEGDFVAVPEFLFEGFCGERIGAAGDFGFGV